MATPDQHLNICWKYMYVNVSHSFKGIFSYVALHKFYGKPLRLL